MADEDVAVSSGVLQTHDLRQLHDGTLLDRVYAELLKPCFPSDELVALDDIRGSYEGDAAYGYGVAAVDAGGDPVGALLADYFPNSRVLLFGYLAVRPDRRGAGIASALVRNFGPAWAAKCDAVLCVAEVEDPRFHRAGPHGDPSARLRLYERLQASLLPFPYVQPAVREGGARVSNMLLISLPGSPAAVPASTVCRFLQEYYGTSEGPDFERDAGYRAMISEALRHGDILPPWSLARYGDVPPLQELLAETP